MYLSKLIFIPDRQRCKDLAVHRDLFREHQMIWNLFDNHPDTRRDFLYRREENPGQMPFYYLLSVREPVGSETMRVETKSFDPVLKKGDQLAFSLRANAVVTRKADDHGKRRIRRDIIEARVDAYKKKYPDPADRPPPAAIHQEAGEAWLERQGERHGFEPQNLLVANHRFHRVRKSGDANIRQFTSLDFTGQLRVSDAEVFRQALIRGLGRSKAFGCGLLLVRRV